MRDSKVCIYVLLTRLPLPPTNFELELLASFKKSKLIGADFSGANLTKADLSDCDLSGANFENADLSGVHARGAIFGLTRDTTKEQIVRAAIKSIALQSKDLIDAYKEDSGKEINELKVDGGATANSYLMQYQADILKIPILLPEITESTALGAAYLAGLTVNLYKSVDEIAKNNKIIKRFMPEMDDSVRNKELKIWKDSVRRLL